MPRSENKDKAVWDSVLSHVSRGEEATKLLEQVFHELGPYKRDPISDETWARVLKFVEYDDSE